jgi:hypothetical protein
MTECQSGPIQLFGTDGTDAAISGKRLGDCLDSRGWTGGPRAAYKCRSCWLAVAGSSKASSQHLVQPPTLHVLHSSSPSFSTARRNNKSSLIPEITMEIVAYLREADQLRQKDSCSTTVELLMMRPPGMADRGSAPFSATDRVSGTAIASPAEVV